MASNIFATGMAAFGDAYDQANKMRTDRARLAAGRRLAAQDYSGAAGELAQGGDLGGATDLMTQDRALQDRQARINAATAYGKGDVPGAVQALGQTGDLQNIAAVQDQARQQHTAAMQYVSQEAAKLKQVKDTYGPGAMLQAFDAQVPNYKAMGSSDQELASLRQGLASNPDAALAALINPKHSFHVAGDTLYVMDDNTGKKIGSYTGAKFQAVKPDETLYQVGGEGDGAPAGAPQAGGSLDPKQFFKDFVLPHEGGLNPSDMNGAPTNFGINQKANPQVDVRKLTPDSAADIFASKYFAQSGADKLPPALAAVHADTYFINPKMAQSFLQQSGGDPTKYMQMRQAWMQNMVATNPAAQKYAQAWANRNADLVKYAAQAGASPAPAQPGGPRIVAQGPLAKGFGEAQANPGLTGDDFLKTLPTGFANQVRLIAEGKMPVSPMMYRTAQGQALLQAVTQYDPTFDAVNYQARSKTRSDFTSGSSAKNLTAFNTALAHLNSLTEAIKGLGNTGLPINNYFAHGIADVTGTNARVERFETVKRTAMDEVNKAIVGSGGALADREALMERMRHTNSPEALYAVVNEVADLLKGKINALGAQYNQGMGTDRYPIQLLTPEAQATLGRLEKLGGGPPKPSPKAPAGVILYDANGNRVQ